MEIMRYGRTEVAAWFTLTVGIMLVCYETFNRGEAIEDMHVLFTGRLLGIVGVVAVLAAVATLVVVRRRRAHSHG